MSPDLQSQTLSLTASFNDAFLDKLIPNNTDIDKGKTGFGITYSELHARRHSIVTIPSVPIIEDKYEDYENKPEEFEGISCFKVIKDVTPEMVKQYLFSGSEFKKLLVTPESFEKIITAAENQVQWLYDNFFCFLDEAHCYVTEAFREDILEPFKWFFNFKNKAMGTATHFQYSDPRFNAMDKYKIRFNEKFGKISIIHDEKPRDVLVTMLTNLDQFEGNVHIFFNSVTEIGEVVQRARLKDVNIFCRDDERNMFNLGDASVHFKHKPQTGQYKKVNTYSCRYNQGWDLMDNENATIILVTDTAIRHSLIGIPFGGFQAVGRLRGHKPHKIYHITNTYDKQTVKDIDQITKECYKAAESHIVYHNNFIDDCNSEGLDHGKGIESEIKKYSDIDEVSCKAVLNPMKVDQVICEKWCNEHYNNIDEVVNQWTECNYETEIVQFEVSKIGKCRRKQSEINKEVIAQLEDLQLNPDKYVFGKINRQLLKIKDEYPILFQGRELLGMEKIKELGYDNKRIQAALIEMSNNNAEAKLRHLLAKTFIKGERYTKKEIKETLQKFYDELEMKKPDGKRLIANAEQLNNYGMFKLKEGKKEDKSGKLKPAFIIEEVYHTLKAAA